MSSDPTWPVAPVMRIMSSGPLLEMGFWGELGWAQPRRAGAAPRNDTLGQPTSSGVDEVRLRRLARGDGNGCGIGSCGLAGAGRLGVLVAVA